MGMTEQEAKEWLECIVYEQAPKTQKAMLLGIKALEEISLYKQCGLCLVPADIYKKQCEKLDELEEKQMPKKPIPYKPWEGKCPACSVVFVNRLTSYCGNCGQALNWGNEDEKI